MYSNIGERIDITKTNSYTTPSDGYISLCNLGSSSGGGSATRVDGNYFIQKYASNMGTYEVTTLFVRKGSIIQDNETTLSNYKLYFYPFEA